MGSSKLVGIVLLVVGVGLLYFGYQSTQSLGNQLSETVTGRFTDQTMWYLIGGAAAAALGLRRIAVSVIHRNWLEGFRTSTLSTNHIKLRVGNRDAKFGCNFLGTLRCDLQLLKNVPVVHHLFALRIPVLVHPSCHPL